MTTISNLITALIIVESSGNDQAIGDNGRAVGPLQIHRAVVLDVNRITGSNYRHQDMTNRAQARAVCEAYLKHYGKGGQYRAARPPLEWGPDWGPQICHRGLLGQG